MPYVLCRHHWRWCSSMGPPNPERLPSQIPLSCCSTAVPSRLSFRVNGVQGTSRWSSFSRTTYRPGLQAHSEQIDVSYSSTKGPFTNPLSPLCIFACSVYCECWPVENALWERAAVQATGEFNDHAILEITYMSAFCSLTHSSYGQMLCVVILLAVRPRTASDCAHSCPILSHWHHSGYIMVSHAVPTCATSNTRHLHPCTHSRAALKSIPSPFLSSRFWHSIFTFSASGAF